MTRAKAGISTQGGHQQEFAGTMLPSRTKILLTKLTVPSSTHETTYLALLLACKGCDSYFVSNALWPGLCTEEGYSELSFLALQRFSHFFFHASCDHNTDSSDSISMWYLLISSITTVLSMAMCTANELHVSKVASFLWGRESERKKEETRGLIKRH